MYLPPHEEEDFSDEFLTEDLSHKNVPGKRKSHQIHDDKMNKVNYRDIYEQPNKKHKNELYKPPTVEELNELKETQNLYNNNLFRLQIEELMNEVKIKKKHRKMFTMWFETFQAMLDQLPEINLLLSDIKMENKKNKLSETDKFIKEIANTTITCDQNFTLKLLKPENCEIFGLDSINALPGSKLLVNLNLKMPRPSFNVKDYLNNRYFVKRFYYLSYIRYYMKEKNIGKEIQWIYHKSNKLLPVLQVKLNEKVTVQIFATPTEHYFRPSRFSTDINNIKTNIFDTGDITEAPTLYYNASLAHDVTLTVNNTFIQEILSQLPNIQEAVKLIYIWLAQRELNVGLGSFTDDLILYFIVYLFTKKKINKHMSSYQVIRKFWNFIDETDLTKNPISLTCDEKSDTLKSFLDNFDIVFLDKTGCYNVTAFLNVGVYRKVKTECGIAFKLLDDRGINSFHSLFISKIPVELQYDLILILKDGTSFKNIIEKMSDVDRMKFMGQPDLFVIKYIENVLSKGLNKRASLIVPVLGETNEMNTICIGINLDSNHAFNILELGPALGDPRENEFKEFWGELSTDRRFKDGSVNVAVYFKTKTVKEKREIVKTIINWIVDHKLKIDYQVYYNDFEEMLVNKKVTASYPMGTNEECCLKGITASDDLGKKLRGLQMPLTITGIQGISDIFSLTDVFPSISTSHRVGNKVTGALENNIIVNEKTVGIVPRYVKPLECVLQLEHSSKWPKDLEGIRHMKTAFYLEISKLLAKKYNLISSVKPDSIDVLYEGFVFRYRLYLSREVGLLKKESTNSGVAVYKSTPESREMEIRFNILPKVIGALKGLQSQYPSFGPATALVKRWLRSQLIDNYHFPDVVVNLLNASLFLNQSAFDFSATPQIGFLRFLKFLSEFQWHIETVIVNFNDEITKEDISQVESKLLQNRESCPNLFIAMPYDNCESLFTKIAPSKEILRRVKQLANETLNHYAKIVRHESAITVKNLFIPNLNGYDVVIHMRPLLNPLRHQQVIGDELEGQIILKPFDPRESTKIPVTDFNPVQCYLKELRDNYGEFANFFHDTHGGNIIGVLWIPKAVENKDFKVSYVSGRKLVDEKLVLNMDALVEDFYILGKGLVKTIDKRK